jgi:hypothetical protein
MNKDMKKGVSEQEVLELLDHLKSAGNEYPSDMIRTRREVFIKQAAAMTVLTGPSGGNGGGSAASISSGLESFSLSRLLEIALVLALAAGAGIMAYIYRDTIADFVNSNLFPKTEFTAVPPQDSSSEPAVIPAMGEEDASGTPTAVSTLTSHLTNTLTMTSTPAPSLATNAGQEADTAENTNEEGLNLEGVVDEQSTPTPNDNSGLHLGQTPKPERTLPPNQNGPPNENRAPGNRRTP